MALGKDFWMDCKEMCKRGIATHVVVCGETITAKEFLKYLKKEKKSERKAKKVAKKKVAKKRAKKSVEKSEKKLEKNT